MNEWETEWIDEWMNEWLKEWMNKIVIKGNSCISFHVVILDRNTLNEEYWIEFFVNYRAEGGLMVW